MFLKILLIQEKALNPVPYKKKNFSKVVAKKKLDFIFRND